MVTLTEQFDNVLAKAESSVRIAYHEMADRHKLIVLRAFKRHVDANMRIGFEHVEPAWLNEFIKDFGVNYKHDVL